VTGLGKKQLTGDAENAEGSRRKQGRAVVDAAKRKISK
jgi:hypothetical protein